jgi:phage head maturation protease
MADELSEIRQVAFTWRLKGGARFTPLHRAQIHHHILNMPERVLFEASEMKLFDQGTPAPGPVAAHVFRAMDSSALSFRCRMTDEGTDLPGDQIKVAGWNLALAARNLPAPLSHDTSALPVGQWSMPYRSGSALDGDVNFPQPGTSAVSDQVRAMVAAGVLRGVSVGFIPGTFRFSSDKQRPLGIDFLEGHTLIEASLCPVPANPRCLVIGPATGTKSAGHVDIADRRREARDLAAKVRAVGESIQSDPVLTREQRIAEAAKFRRAAHSV